MVNPSALIVVMKRTVLLTHVLLGSGLVLMGLVYQKKNVVIVTMIALTILMKLFVPQLQFVILVSGSVVMALAYS